MTEEQLAAARAKDHVKEIARTKKYQEDHGYRAKYRAYQDEYRKRPGVSEKYAAAAREKARLKRLSAPPKRVPYTPEEKAAALKAAQIRYRQSVKSKETQKSWRAEYQKRPDVKERHRQQVAKDRAKWTPEEREAHRLLSLKWSADNREYKNAMERARRAVMTPEQHEACLASLREYSLKNKESLRVKAQERLNNPIALAALRARLQNRRVLNGILLTPEVVADVLKTKHCHYCDEPIEIMRNVRQHPRKATVDHVLAISRGGTHARENLVAACLACNVSKGNRPYERFVARMRQKKAA